MRVCFCFNEEIILSSITCNSLGAPSNTEIYDAVCRMPPAKMNGMVIGSFFENKLDNKPLMLEGQWCELVDIFEYCSGVPRNPVKKDGSKSNTGRWLEMPTTPAFCPAEYPEGSLRRKANVLRWNWFAADIDNDKGPDAYVSFKDMQAILEYYGLAYILYTTTKSRPGQDRYRLMMPLTRPIEAFEFPEVWYATNRFFGEIFDSATRDISRLLYVPAKWTGSNVQFAHSGGLAWDIDVAMSLFPAPRLVEPKPSFSAEAIQSMRLLAVNDPRLMSNNANLNPTSFITERMKQDFCSSSEGGRFYRLMVRIAMHAMSKGRPLTEEELGKVALDFDRLATGKPRDNVLGEARNALTFAAENLSQNDFDRRVARHVHRFSKRIAK